MTKNGQNTGVFSMAQQNDENRMDNNQDNRINLINQIEENF